MDEHMFKLYTRNEIHKLCVEEAAKSPCGKRKVGAILATSFQDGQWGIIASGHNFNPVSDVCEGPDGNTLPDVIHAEVACINVARLTPRESTVKRVDATMFVTHQPCANCMEVIAKFAEDFNLELSIEVVGEFMKFSQSKPRVALVPSTLQLAAARAMTYGAKKYKVDNWRNTPDIECYVSALMRHLFAWNEGEEVDPESGLNHLDHMAANLAFLIELQHLPKKASK